MPTKNVTALGIAYISQLWKLRFVVKKMKGEVDNDQAQPTIRHVILVLENVWRRRFTAQARVYFDRKPVTTHKLLSPWSPCYWCVRIWCREKWLTKKKSFETRNRSDASFECFGVVIIYITEVPTVMSALDSHWRKLTFDRSFDVGIATSPRWRTKSSLHYKVTISATLTVRTNKIVFFFFSRSRISQQIRTHVVTCTCFWLVIRMTSLGVYTLPGHNSCGTPSKVRVFHSPFLQHES